MIPLNQKGRAARVICHGGVCRPVLDRAVSKGILNADGSPTASTKTYAKMIDSKFKRTQDMDHENFIQIGTDGQVTVSIQFMIAAELVDEKTGLPTPKAEAIIKRMSQPAATADKKCSCQKKAKKSGSLSQERINKIVKDVFAKHKRSKNFLDTKPSDVPVERVPRSGIEALYQGSREGHQHGQDVINRLWGRSASKTSTGVTNNQTIVGKGLFRSTR